MEATLSQETRSLQWALPEQMQVPPDELQIRLDFFQESIVMHLVSEGTVTTRLVSAQDVALAMLSGIPLSSDLLPPDTLWWAQSSDGPQIATWREPRVYQFGLVGDPRKPPVRMRLPMPGLIFVCRSAQPPRVYAAKKRPTKPKDRVFRAPLFNVFRSGKSCSGSHKYPPRIADIPDSFLRSFFAVSESYGEKSKKYPKNLMDLYREIEGKEEYPVSDLIPSGQVADVMKGDLGE